MPALVVRRKDPRNEYASSCSAAGQGRELQKATTIR